ncbi:MAG: PfkB family carbohydrate kinase [Gemmataceae bacterium]
MSLTPDQLEHILASAHKYTIGVLGDLFLDRYLDLDGRWTEPSIETGLDAYQVVRVRSLPGAAGTVINNLVALGVGRVVPLSLIGVDGEGFELLQALTHPNILVDGILREPTRRTPAYIKPMLGFPGELPRELNRIDIHPREPLSLTIQNKILTNIQTWLPHLDALAILDQVRTPDAGVLTASVRAFFAAHPPPIPVLADSRFRIGCFSGVMLKPNEAEALAAVPHAADPLTAAENLARQCGRTVFLTQGARGICCVSPDQPTQQIPAYRVSGPTDPVGAGDSTTAGILTALVAGLPVGTAAAFGCLVASITVTQLGTTGVATPTDLRNRLGMQLSSENS